MDEKLFITLTPGNTFIDRLTGKTKVRIFFLLIFILTFTWDVRIMIPIFILSVISLISIKPDKKKNTPVAKYPKFCNGTSYHHILGSPYTLTRY